MRHSDSLNVNSTERYRKLKNRSVKVKKKLEVIKKTQRLIDS